ncbi:MAG: DUF4199 domain-containing protein [Candidatus Marinimicrobia bacterium]|nr:DUF4199 domain-containing protein [Candidatus Neomarinimicrobiota bacterium]
MKKYAIDIKWGFIFIAVTLLWMVLERLLGFHDQNIELHTIVTNLFFFPAVAVYVFGIRDKKKNFYQDEMTYFRGFKTGLIMTLVVTVFSPLTQILTVEVITPHYFSNMINFVVESGKMTQIQAEQYFNLKNYTLQTLVFSPLMGLVTAAVVAVFFKEKK